MTDAGGVQERLVELMERMGRGERAAVFALHSEFGDRLAGVLRRKLRRRGIDAIAREDLDGLVVDACVAIAEVASAWRPSGGALPWSWAHHRLEAVVQRYVGQHTDPLDDARLALLADTPAPPAAAADEAEALDLLDDLAATDPVCGLLREALGRAGTERDQRLLLEVELQQSLGDRAPAATVASMFDMRPDAVRQQVRRVRTRLRRLVADEPRYAVLAQLPLVA